MPPDPRRREMLKCALLYLRVDIQTGCPAGGGPVRRTFQGLGAGGIARVFYNQRPRVQPRGG